MTSAMKMIQNMSLVTRVGITVFTFTFLLSGSGGLFYYYSTHNFVLRQMSGRLLDIGRTGAYLFTEEDRANIEKLTKQIHNQRTPLSPSDLKFKSDESPETLKPADSAKLMESESFKNLVQKLRQIRDGSRTKVSPLREIPQLPEDESDLPLVTYVYLLIPLPESKDYTVTMFLADGDYLDADEDGDGEISDEETGTPIGMIWQTPLQEFKTAFSGEAHAASEWYTDTWGTWLSAAVPIKNREGKTIAVLGLDYDIQGEANLLTRFQQVAVGMIAVGMLFSLLLAWLLASRIRKRLDPLTDGVNKMKNRDFSVSIPSTSNDELGRLGEAFNSMVMEIKAYSDSLETLNKSFERFVPKEFLTEMGHESVLTLSLGDGISRDMTVMFCDIRSYTNRSESMTPDENFKYLNNYLSRIGPIIRENGGFIDKYIGDAVMALYPSGAAGAISAASQMLLELAIYNHELRENNQPEIRFGIGMHHGEVMLGTVGEDQRIDTTVISDTVNAAARLEELTKKIGATVLLSDSVVEKAKQSGVEPAIRYLGAIHLRGKTKQMGMYELLDGLPSTEQETKIESAEELQRALELIRVKQYPAALKVFRELKEKYPADTTLPVFIEKLEKK